MGFILAVAGLAWAETVMEGVFFIMQTYFTDVWKLSFTNAATFLNIWGGLYRISPFFFLFLADTVVGNFAMLTLSGIFSTTGIVLITVATTPIFGHLVSGGRCQDKEDTECVGHTEKVLFITGMALIAIGRGARFASTEPFIDDNDTMSNHEEDEEPKLPLMLLMACMIVVFYFTPLAVIIAFPYVNKWYVLFGVSACCTTLATLFYLTGTCAYRKQGPRAEGSPITNFFRVESAIILIRTVPIWSSFIMCGVVASIGNTYFIEQASHMNSNIGRWKAPLQLLLLVFTFAKYSAMSIIALLKSIKGKDRRIDIGGMAILYSVVCCLVAAAVERRRVHVLRRHDLLDLPDDGKVPMTAAWLYFQIAFLALVESCSQYGLSGFLESEAPESIKSYHDCLVEGVTGLGYICGALSVYVVGKVSETGGANNWFQATLNRSRLDRYYWVLAALCSLNYIAYHIMASIYLTMKTQQPEENYDVEQVLNRIQQNSSEIYFIKKGSAFDLVARYFRG